MDNCIFCKIVTKEIPKEFTFESEHVVVFPDIHPVRPTHLLVVPKKHIKDFGELNDANIWHEVREVVQKVVKKTSLDSGSGYRLTVNGGGAQVIDHLHLHITGPIKKTDSV